MKCPLSITGEMARGGAFTGAAADCMQAECAWWDIENSQCAINFLSAIASLLQYWLKAIRDGKSRGGKE